MCEAGCALCWGILVPAYNNFGYGESAEENDTKNLCSDVYQAHVSIIRAFLLVSLLEMVQKNSTTSFMWDSLAYPHFTDNRMQAKVCITCTDRIQGE